MTLQLSDYESDPDELPGEIVGQAADDEGGHAMERDDEDSLRHRSDKKGILNKASKKARFIFIDLCMYSLISYRVLIE